MEGCLQEERLAYFEMLMQVCERRGLSQAAGQFALAAVAELPAAFAPDGAGAAQRAECGGRLWANLLTYALDEADFEVPALLSLISRLA